MQRATVVTRVVRVPVPFPSHCVKVFFMSHNIHLLYNKTVVDLCFGRHGVFLNSKLNHIDIRSTSVNMTFTVQ